MSESTYPRGLAHVGLTVPDLDEAIDWYCDVLGFSHVKGPDEITANEGYGGRQAANLLGEFETMRFAHLATGNQIGIELFEFASTDANSEPDPTRAGLFHLCVIDPDVEGLAARIDEHGGDHYSEIWEIFEDDDEYTLTYCKDPYGNLLEIYSHSHERIYSNRDA
ncbi:VOC family protein [Haloarchaeobius sp. DYHT-AS-18]|uniref:VOC family protein n=1 Tax=Haloarchaeobius sp. DYHT-AS-18 TaxID=3446117 RepID=UPI003EB757F4